MDYSNPDAITLPFQLTAKLWRNMNPFLEPSKPEYSAKGKNVLITGVSGGVGRAIAEAWTVAQADGILITGRNLEKLNEVAQKLRSISLASKIVVQTADLTQEASVAELWSKAHSELGVIHVLINDAGTMNYGGSGEIEPAQWWRDYEVNVKAPYLMNHHFLKQGGSKGTTITISSGAAGFEAPNMSSYIPSKLAQTKVTELLQLEHPELRTFTLLPGLLSTGMTAEAFYPFAKDDPMLTGGLSLYLSTPRADWLKGQLVSVNWDIEEMEAHKEEIVSKNLLKLGYVRANLGPEGHPWSK